MKKTISDYQKEVKKLDSLLDDLRSENIDIQMSHDNLNRDLIATCKENSNFMDLIDSLRSELSQKDSTIHELSTLCSKNLSEIDGLKTKISSSERWADLRNDQVGKLVDAMLNLSKRISTDCE